MTAIENIQKYCYTTQKSESIEGMSKGHFISCEHPYDVLETFVRY
ncbi:hypothetical protein DMN91_004078, partial [Ooceraea biroi]